MKVMTVVGARPQFIKSAAVSRALQQQGIVEILVHTGQHYDDEMSEIFFRQLGLSAPKYNLGVGSDTHAAQTGRMLQALDVVIDGDEPDVLLTYGDTNSTLAGALVGAKLGIPTAHVEAGLRSFNRRMPEEINRIVADALADLLFVPTEVARANLEREGISRERIHVVGDVMFDVALAFRECALRDSRILEQLGLEPSRYVLATIHRAENTDNESRLSVIVSALAEIAGDLPVLWPMHPRTRSRLADLGLLHAAEKLATITAPLGYLDMVRAEAQAAVILTDSGGVQKEAFFQSVPCVTVRDETEWTELVDLGWNRLAPPETSKTIVDAVRRARGTRGTSGDPYGDGHAAEKIVEVLLRERI